MNCLLTRNKAALYGVLGVLTPLSGGDPICVTLEHAYADGAAFVPKLATGTYTCVRYKSPRLGYVLFAIEKAPDFQGAPVTWIEMHIGNYNTDSIGCILLGTAVGTGMIEDSRVAFDAFMGLQKDVDSFTLVVC